MRARWFILLVVGLGSATLAGGLLMFMENAFIYFPTTYPSGNWNPTQVEGCSIEDVYFEAEDGVRPHSWFLENPSSKRVLVYYHGNAGSIADRYEWGCQLKGVGASVLMVEYRGYGRSEGSPGEAGFYKDAEAVWKWLVQTKGYAANQIILYGKSLGGGVAAELSTRHSPGALVLQSTFTSIPDMAKIVLPFVPKFMIRTRFQTIDKLSQIDCPVLVIHSRDDEIVPFQMGERLAQKAGKLHGFLQFSNYGHNDLIWGEGEKIVAGIRGILK